MRGLGQDVCFLLSKVDSGPYTGHFVECVLDIACTIAAMHAGDRQLIMVGIMGRVGIFHFDGRDGFCSAAAAVFGLAAEFEYGLPYCIYKQQGAGRYNDFIHNFLSGVSKEGDDPLFEHLSAESLHVMHTGM